MNMKVMASKVDNFSRYTPLPTSIASASAKARCASCGNPVKTTEADMVKGISTPWSSSGIAVLPAALESLLPVTLGRCASAGDDTAGCGESRREPSEGAGEDMAMLSRFCGEAEL